MFKKILIGLVVIVVILVVVIAMQPAAFSLSRSTTVNAPAQTVFEQVNDFRKWSAWSPWEKMDTDLKRTYGEPSAGLGGTYAWVGDKTGEGKMTITESKPGEVVRIKLEFFKPMEATNTTVFEFKPNGGQTTVVWTMSGENNFVGKAFSLLMSMDKMVGGHFEQGLADLKKVSEAAPRP